MERILIAVDDSVESLAAARCALRLAVGWNAAVRILTAIAEGNVEGVAASSPSERRRAAERLLEHVAGEARAIGLAPERVETIVRSGEAFSAILEEARTWRAELIVMAVSHRKSLRSPYVGSQTEHVLEFAECPVLIVPHG